jgi:spore coat protein A
MDEVSPRPSGDAAPTALTRRTVLRAAAGGFGLFFLANVGGARWIVEASATSTGPRLLNPKRIPKFQIPMPIPSVMPTADLASAGSGTPIDYYEIAVRQFTAQVLPAPLPRTTVWGYGPAARAVSPHRNSARPHPRSRPKSVARYE